MMPGNLSVSVARKSGWSLLIRHRHMNMLLVPRCCWRKWYSLDWRLPLKYGMEWWNGMMGWNDRMMMEWGWNVNKFLVSLLCWIIPLHLHASIIPAFNSIIIPPFHSTISFHILAVAILGTSSLYSDVVLWTALCPTKSSKICQYYANCCESLAASAENKAPVC